MGKSFTLTATVSTDNPAAIFPVLKELIGDHGTVEKIGENRERTASIGEFNVRADLQGESAKELNRDLLSALRRVEKKTRLRSAWSAGGEVEQYFDYVCKRSSPKS